MVNLVGRLAFQGHVRTELIVPEQKPADVIPEVLSPGRNHDLPSAAFFQRPDKTLHDCDAAVLSHRAEAGIDSTGSAPSLVVVAPELSAFVGDQVFGGLARLLDHTIQKGLHSTSGGRYSRDTKAHGPAGEMIDDHDHPPTERPTLGQRIGQPGHPESGKNGNRGQIDVPDVIGPVGHHNDFVCGRWFLP